VKTLRLGGRDLRCIDKLPLGLLFDLAEAMSSGTENTMRAVAAMSTVVKTVVVKEDLASLSEVLHDTTNVVDITELNEAIGNLMVQYAERPTVKPSVSLNGRERTGGSSKVVSLSRGTVRVDEASPTDGASVAS